MHLKRIPMPKNWLFPKRDYTYIVSPRAGQNKDYSLPILVILRDVLKLLKTTREAKIILKEGNVLVNGKEIKDFKYSVGLFDRIYVKKEEKFFTVLLNARGLIVSEISQKDSEIKPIKVINKTKLKTNKIQINCSDGRNFLYDKEVKTGDTIIVNLKENKVLKIVPLKNGSNVLILGGKHKGSIGKVESIGKKELVVNLEKEKSPIQSKNIFVIE